MTLGDILPNDSLKKSKIQFLTPEGTVCKVDFKGKLVNEVYKYWRTKDDPEQGEGWYLNSDSNGDINQNARVIEFGDSYCIENLDGEAAAVSFNGAVSAETTKFFTNMGFNYIGNCCPTRITLGDIVPNASLKKSKIQFLTSEGTVCKVDFKGKLVNEVYKYWRTKDDPEQGEGWYLNSDSNGDINQNARVLEAGESFCVENLDNDAAGVELPDPLTVKPVAD